MAEQQSSGAPLRVVAIDGVLGAGKTTVAQRLAVALGLEYLDTGAMYRSVGLACERRGVDLSDGDAVAAVARDASISVQTRADGSQLVELDGDDVTAAIRTPEAAKGASLVATLPAVRAELVRRQRAWARERGGGVLEGRDIATVVFPDAVARIFLTADVEERARRRHAELPHLTLDEVRADLEWRDHNDATREADPLKVADGAHVLDTTGLDIDEVVRRAAALVPGPSSVTTKGVDAESPAALPGADAPRPPTRGELRLFAFGRSIVLAFARLYWRVSFEGLHNVPTTGAYLIAPVHRSNVDSLVVPGLTGRRIRFLGKASMWKFATIGRLFDALGGIKVHRGTTDRESMRACIDALVGGEPLVVYPEGTRREGPVVAELFDGAAYLANRVGVPIVPVGIGGSQKAMGRGHRLPRPHRIHVIVGPALDPAEHGTGKGSRRAVRALTAALHTELQRLFDEAQRVAG